MQLKHSFAIKRWIALTFSSIFCALVPQTVAQSSKVQSSGRAHGLITQPVDESQLTVLHGNTHPLARPQSDLGTAPAALPMQRMLLVLKRSSQQEAALRRLLDDQQDKASPSYHQWLTPEDFGKQFGPSDADLVTITGWLQSHGFQVGQTKGRTVLEFSGNAGQVQQAFHTTIHKYIVDGEEHWANASDPSIPTALTPAVAGMASLNNFTRRAMNVLAGKATRDKATGKIHVENSQFTWPQGCVEGLLNSDACSDWLGPYDFATIYNLLPLWNAGINGAGVTIAISGETDINVQDVRDFRSLFGLAANDPTFIVNGPDPGIQGDESEADIDVQWSGAVAPNATIDFVISQSTETTSGVDLSAVYIVDYNLAPIMSESYGECELGIGTTGNQFYNTLWQQAAAQGITVFISAGDGGSAGCDDFDASPPSPAQYGLQVSGYASTPYNVAVGGTDFNDFTNPSTYWSTTNNPTTLESALRYIPETTWNDSCTNAIWVTLSWGSNAEAVCNNTQLNDVITVGGSGGESDCTTPSGSTVSSCAGGYVKPSWQTGTGVPNDGKRDIPDVSLFASNGFMGSAYSICQADLNEEGPCPDVIWGFGGTSVSSPAFAGIMALINQEYGRQGNANYVFYKLAAKAGASCTSSGSESSSCIFNDVTVGTNEMPCAAGSPNCDTSAGDIYGILTGYNAGAGYDLATGLGSVNANNLVNEWNSVTFLPSTTTLNSLTPTTVTHGQPVSFSVTVAPQSGSGMPTGAISIFSATASNNTDVGAFNLSSGTVSGTTNLLPGGTYSVMAHYPGDGNYAASDSNALSVTVNKENSSPQVFLVTFNSEGSILNGDTTTAVYGSPYLLRVNVDNSAGQLCAPVGEASATACPTGTVAMTNNGATLDAGTYTLNSYGYFEDQIVQLPGGTDSVRAAYSGDNSFNASSATGAMTITPAATTMPAPSLYSGIPFVGLPATISANVSTTSSGVAPSGTVTFYANGEALLGTVSYTPIAGSGSAPAALGAIITTNSNAFPTSGSYALTATYNGDTNYSTSTSPANNISVTYPAPSLVVTPTNQTVSYGNSATIAVLVDASNKTVYPTGTVTFTNANTGAVISRPVPCTNATQSNGNYACSAALTLTVTSNGTIGIQYSGDANYPPTYGAASIVMPDFGLNLAGGGGSITAGQSQTVTINVQSSNSFSGTVGNFTCSGLPAETTCTFSPTQVSVSGNNSVPVSLTIATTAIGQSRKRAANEGGTKLWRLSPAVLLLGACFIGIPLSRRRGRVPVALLLVISFALLSSCGGGSSGGSSGNGTLNPVPSISSLSPTQVAAGSQVNSLYINGSNFLSTSTVTYNGAIHSSSLQSSTQLQIALAPSDVATTGQYPVVVTNPSPGGGASAPSNFAVVTGTPTGVFYFTMTATSGPITNTLNLNMTVQ